MIASITAGHATLAGKRERNGDFVGMVMPNEPDLSNKGLIAAIADGVSGDEGGREAAEYAVRGLLSDYYATPDTWSVTQALERVIKATNTWIQQQGSVRPELAGMATTLTCVVLRGRFYYYAHVGDTRLYLLRDGVLTRLTADHVWDRAELRHVLTRAIGLDSRITVDRGIGELQQRDIFLLASDGVWAAITECDLTRQLTTTLFDNKDPEQTAQALVAAALAAGGSDDASALVLRVDQLPEANLHDAQSVSQQLPRPPKLKVGQGIDGYQAEELMQKAVARGPADRFETAEEFLLAPERGATRPLSASAPMPLVKRNPAFLWRAIAVISVLLNLLLLYLLVIR